MRWMDDPQGQAQATQTLQRRRMEQVPRTCRRCPHPDLDQRESGIRPRRQGKTQDPSERIHRLTGARSQERKRSLQRNLAKY